MKVGIITPRYPPNIAGGGELEVELLAQKLSESPRIDRIVVFSFDGSCNSLKSGVEVRRLANISSLIMEMKNLRAYRHLRGRLEKFEVVHSYNMELHPLVGGLTANRSVGSVGTLNSYRFLPSSVSNVQPTGIERVYERLAQPTTLRVLRHYMRKIGEFIAISNAVKNNFIEYGFSGEKIQVIGSFLDPSFEIPTVEETDGYTILFVGTLSKIKGVRYLLQAVPELPEEFSVRIVGSGPESEKLQNLCNSYNISKRVTFTGHVEYGQLLEEYARADVFVHPGIWPEPFGRTLLEAMQSELPVVCTDIGGPAEIVPDPELKCKPKDATCLAEAIEQAVSKEPDLGKLNRQYVWENYDPADLVPKIIDTYEQVAHE